MTEIFDAKNSHFFSVQNGTVQGNFRKCLEKDFVMSYMKSFARQHSMRGRAVRYAR